MLKIQLINHSEDQKRIWIFYTLHETVHQYSYKKKIRRFSGVSKRGAMNYTL